MHSETGRSSIRSLPPFVRVTLRRWTKIYRGVKGLFAPVADLTVRLAVAQTFFQSGIVKLGNWPAALALAEFEYPVDFMAPDTAALVGVAIELIGPFLLALGLFGFGKVKPGFFPQSARPEFVLDYWLPQGTHIQRTLADTERLERFVMELDGVEKVSTWVGRGAIRFMLVYSPEDANSAYAQLLITVRDHRMIDALTEKIRAELDAHYLDAQYKLWKFVLGPGGGSAIEARFAGPETAVL
ncbi:MAG: DoxX family membrane protein, partial [Sphingomonadaceae bacterium]|nr:DoxX family membrane protein [Sphingomonadaceae bacterium]